MLVSYKTLQQYVQTSLEPKALGEKFLMTSSELEKVIDWSAALEGVVTGKVITCEPHPNASKLHVTTVDVGAGELRQIVCGAPNVAAGQMVLVALPGAVVKSIKGEVMTIAEVELRGEKSQGMLCAPSELGLSIQPPIDGIWVLPEDTLIGQPASVALGLDDVVLDLEITPNRPDLLSYSGLAREVSTFEARPLHLPALAELPKPSADILTTEVKYHAGATRLSAVQLTLTDNPASPWWLQRTLLLSGMRPVNAIVDVTNLVMLELGQPLHAYDLDLISTAGKTKLSVETVKVPTQIHLLDGTSRLAEPGDAVITSNGSIAGFGGIMGGQESAISATTRSIIIEAAHFVGPVIRRTSRRLGLRTEASGRFEKGIDSELTLQALARTVQLFTDLGLLEAVHALADVQSVPLPTLPSISLTLDRYESLIGSGISVPEAKHILERLGFTVKGASKSSFTCQPPTWRSDIQREEDVIEELVRISGYERVPLTLPSGTVKSPARNQLFYRKEDIRSALANQGMWESVSLPFTDANELKLFGIDTALPLLNPLSTEQSHLLPTHLIPFLNLVSEHQKIDELSYFEIGKIFAAPHTETLTASFIVRTPEDPEVLFRRAKRALGSILGATPWSLHNEDASNSWFEPGTTYSVHQHGVILGKIGMVSHKLVTSKKIRRGTSMIFCSLNLQPILEYPQVYMPYAQVPSLPPVERDVTLHVDEVVTWGAIEEVIKQAPNPNLESFTYVTTFRNDKIGAGKKAITMHFVYRSLERTLTDAEVDAHQKQLTQALVEAFNATVS